MSRISLRSTDRRFSRWLWVLPTRCQRDVSTHQPGLRGPRIGAIPMSTKQGIASAIVTKIGSTKFSIWRIGLTHDWVQRKTEWSNSGEYVKHWSCWETESLSDAQDIENHFINKGMIGGTGGNLSSRKTVFVYVF